MFIYLHLTNVDSLGPVSSKNGFMLIVPNLNKYLLQ